MKPPRQLDLRAMREPSRDFGILPFWFLNGELDPDEMRWQLKELFDKGMHGVVFHGRYGLEMPYLGPRYLDRIRHGVEEANRLGLAAWIYDEMNWPSGTADKRVLRERPDLAQRYLECVSFSIRGPWFMCLTGEDSRYLDFERSTPVAMFAIGGAGEVVDLTSNLSFKKVVPWEVPPGEWRLCYIVEKRADYYIDALDPESTKTFLRVGYDPYARVVSNGHTDHKPLVGFYSDEPAMHYFLTAGDNSIVPWTKDMFRRFKERNGYDLRSRLLDLFFDLRPEAARTRHDFYNTTTDFYSDAYYRQIHQWCRDHNVLFTAHLLYEEWIRQMVRVEGNPFRHYRHMDVVAVDHLYPVIGTREAPDQHVAMKMASSAAHHFGSERLICESFGGIFMDATMQRMKWVTDWEYVLGVNLLNPHGFHYTFEGARKRDWPPSMFYQYPWWRYYEEFSAYVSRLSEMLSGGRHVAKLALLWPINAMFAAYLPHQHTVDSRVIEAGLNVVTDLLLRLHHDFDYLDEDVLADAQIADGRLVVRGEEYELLVVPPMPYLRSSTVDALERFSSAGGRVLGLLRAPRHAFGPDGIIDVEERIQALWGDSTTAKGNETGFEVSTYGADPVTAAFVHGDPAALATPPGDLRDLFAAALDRAIRSLIRPDVEISNPDLFVLHRRRDDSDMYFVANTTFETQRAEFRLPGEPSPLMFDPTSGETTTVRAWNEDGFTTVDLELPPVGSTFVVTGRAAEDASALTPGALAGNAPTGEEPSTREAEKSIKLDGPWTFEAEDDNALVIKNWWARVEGPDDDPAQLSSPGDARVVGWDRVVAGAWAYQLSAEPTAEWPIVVWYRIHFEVQDLPPSLSLLVDGFSGESVALWMNGYEIESDPVRSRIDSQMKEIDLGDRVRAGENVVLVRLTLGDATGGLVDHVKLLGRFEVGGSSEENTCIVAVTKEASPSSWTEQGYPFLSGCGVYRTTFELPPPDAARRITVQIPMFDDVVEVEVNGRRAGVRLWHPYRIDISGLASPGVNEIAFRVANTPANLLNGYARPSGLAAAPIVVLGPRYNANAHARTSSTEAADQ
jgi:alpha-L-rhamnosidase